MWAQDERKKTPVKDAAETPFGWAQGKARCKTRKSDTPVEKRDQQKSGGPGSDSDATAFDHEQLA